MSQLMGQQTDLLTSNVKNLVFDYLGKDTARAEALDKLGLISDMPIDKKTTPMDTLTHYLSKKLSYGKFSIFAAVLEYRTIPYSFKL